MINRIRKNKWKIVAILAGMILGAVVGNFFGFLFNRM